MARIITLTTDFGMADEYVGVMKGVILARAPAATIVDISHAIQGQNILQAALLIPAVYSFFPKGTIHVVVVDPGVGSNRQLILLCADGHLFLAPDNGVLSLLLKPGCFEAAYAIQCKEFFLSPLSSTFHGRDILAPVAAQLAAGLAPEHAGPGLELQALRQIDIPSAEMDRGLGKIRGEVVAVDHFGNLRTNISVESLKELSLHDFPVRIKIRGKTIDGVQKAYGTSAPGTLLAVIGSRGFLEIAVNLGNAASVLGAAAGTIVELQAVASQD